MRHERSVLGLPPVALEKARHPTVATSAVPHQRAARSEDTSELGERAPIVCRIEKEAERSAQVDDGVEPPSPGARKPPHVAAPIAQRSAGTLRLRLGEQLGRAA